jgi:probable HAF family extracellular repeat protein
MVFVDLLLRVSIISRNRGGSNPPGRRPRLTLEALEDRTLLNYSITDLGTFGGNVSAAYGINNRGQVVGSAQLECNCVTHPYLWAEGVLHDLGAMPGATSNSALGINELGQVAGSSTHAFLWSRESGMVDLGFPGEASKVNNRTQVAGTIYGSPEQAFLWTNGTVRELGGLYGAGSAAYGLNNLGQVVGQSGGRAFLWTEQAGIKDLGTFSGSAGANAINDLGQIVGVSYSGVFGSHAAYFSRQGPIDLGTLGGPSEASAINNLGQVVGDAGGRAFLTDLNGGPMVDLYTLIPPNSGWLGLINARGINDAGEIIGTGVLPGYDNVHAYLLTPDDSLVAALLTGAPQSRNAAIPAADVCACHNLSFPTGSSPAAPGVVNAQRSTPQLEETSVATPVSLLAVNADSQAVSSAWPDAVWDELR